VRDESREKILTSLAVGGSADAAIESLAHGETWPNQLRLLSTGQARRAWHSRRVGTRFYHLQACGEPDPY
jgi:hypothetical protein